MVRSFVWGMPSRRTNNSPESGRGLGHVTPTIFGSTVGYPSDSLASCFVIPTERDERFLYEYQFYRQTGNIVMRIIATSKIVETTKIQNTSLDGSGSV